MALLHHLESLWIDYEKRGADLVFTVGELSTDPELHAPSKVCGETRFVLDFRSASEDTMRDMVAGARGGEARR